LDRHNVLLSPFFLNNVNVIKISVNIGLAPPSVLVGFCVRVTLASFAAMLASVDVSPAILSVKDLTLPTKIPF
jgi:hypothetical protein